jgi:hypothetical protein
MSNQAQTDVRQVALNLWTTLSHSVGKPMGMSFSPGTLSAAADVAQSVTPVQGTRLSPGGVPLDHFAPSVWHAACFLLVSYILPRLNRAPFSSDNALFETFFGNAPVYRGQARAWNILPSGWRSRQPAQDQHRRLVFRELLASYMGADDAIEFELFGRVQSAAEADAVAQHYGMGTDFVDVTFDPRVALYFACCQSAGSGAPGPDSVPESCAVVYFISFLKLCLSGRPALTFPPVQAQRLFRQAGFFVNYGARPPEIEAVMDYDEPWTWVQQNSARLFFPRSYPNTPELAQMPPAVLDSFSPEPFFDDAISRINRLTSKQLAASPRALAESLRSEIKTRPPWRVKEFDRAFIYTEDEFVTIFQYVEHYVRVAALLEMGRQPCLDPVVIGKFGELDSSGLKALKQVSLIPYGSGHAVQWIVDRIHESLNALNDYLSRSPS